MKVSLFKHEKLQITSTKITVTNYKYKLQSSLKNTDRQTDRQLQHKHGHRANIDVYV